MIGALIGDIAGSRFEWHNIKSKSFELLVKGLCRPTDDSVMTLAVASAVLECGPGFEGLSELAVKHMQAFGRRYPKAGYGRRFYDWIYSEDPKPYHSWGNGSAMRVSACGYAASSLEEATWLARKVTVVTHDHPDGVKGAEAVAAAIYMALHGSSKPEISDYISMHYYKVDFMLNDIRAEYSFDVSCQGSVPMAFAAFYEADGFEDAIRNAISIGGDSDTIAAMAGSMAEAYYGVPEELRREALTFLDSYQKEVLEKFEEKYPAKANTEA